MPDTVDLTLSYTVNDPGQPEVVRSWARQIAATELIGGMVVSVPTTGYTLDLSAYTLDTLFIRNRDTFNPCILSWQLLGSPFAFVSPTNELGFFVGPPETITIVTGSQDWTAAPFSVRVGEFILIAGAQEASNNGTFVVEAVTSTTLDLGNGAGLTADPVDTGAASALKVEKRRARILPEGWFTLTGSEITGNLTLTGENSASDVEIWAFGT